MYDLNLDEANAIPFVMVDAAGAEVAGLGGTFTVTLRKDGGTFGASAGATTELASGWYLYTATAGECDTAGQLALTITGAGAAQQNLVYRVWAKDISANVGTYSYSNTVDDGSLNLLDGVFIQLATDSGFTNIVSTTYTNAIGAFTVRSDTAGTHYLRLQLAGYEFAIQTVTLA